MDEQQILDHLKRAFELEESGDIRSAIPFFQEAADGLDSIAEDEEDSQRRRKLRERARGYGSHARGLEKKLKDAEVCCRSTSNRLGIAHCKLHIALFGPAGPQ